MSVALAVAPDDVGPADPVTAARRKLKGAIAARGKAITAVSASRAASGRARGLVTELSAAVETHLGRAKKVSLTRAGDIAAALRTGKAAKFETVAELPVIEAARLESESQLQAARAALEELQRDEAAAESELEAAEAKVVSARTAIVLFEAQGIAERFEDLEAEAAELREQLGLSTYALGRILGGSLTPALARAMAGANWLTNGHEMRRALAHSAHWDDFYNRLASNPDAELSFDPPAAAEAAGLKMLSSRRGYD